MAFWRNKAKWNRSAINTSVCLIGCSIGDFGALFYFAHFSPATSLMVQMVTAIIAGISTSIMLETLIMRLKEGFSWFEALKTAMGMSLISMISMEIAMNVVDFTLTRPYNLTVSDLYWWLALMPAILAGFLTAWPYNYWRLAKFGKSCCSGK